MNSSKKSFLTLVAVFVAPIVIGTIWFYGVDRSSLMGNTTNYGILLKPAFPLDISGLMQSSDSGSIDSAKAENTLNKKWTLLYLAPDQCDQACQDKLLLIYRVRLLMNEQLRRVRTVLVANNVAQEQSIKKIKIVKKDRYLDMVFTHTESKQSPFFRQFPDREKSPVYLIDPLGNLMMHYPQENPDAKKMIKDLSQLLKYSHLG